MDTEGSYGRPVIGLVRCQAAHLQVQHSGLTPDRLNGMRLVIFLGMLADQNNWDLKRSYLVPAELAATVQLYQTTGISPNEHGDFEWVHPMILQQRRNSQLSSERVAEFIRSMKRLHSSRKSSTVMYCVQAATVCQITILCQACWYKLPGGGGRDQFTTRKWNRDYLFSTPVSGVHPQKEVARRLQYS